MKLVLPPQVDTVIELPNPETVYQTPGEVCNTSKPHGPTSSKVAPIVVPFVIAEKVGRSVPLAACSEYPPLAILNLLRRCRWHLSSYKILLPRTSTATGKSSLSRGKPTQNRVGAVLCHFP